MKKPQLQTEFDSPNESPGFLLWQISNQWQSRQRKALSAYGLTHVQFVLLASLVWATDKATITQRELAENSKTNVMMTSQVLRLLEKKGLVTRKINASDGRSLVLNPTMNGIKLVNVAIETVEAVDKKFFEKLGNDRDLFTKMMQLLVE